MKNWRTGCSAGFGPVGAKSLRAGIRRTTPGPGTLVGGGIRPIADRSIFPDAASLALIQLSSLACRYYRNPLVCEV